MSNVRRTVAQLGGPTITLAAILAVAGFTVVVLAAPGSFPGTASASVPPAASSPAGLDSSTLVPLGVVCGVGAAVVALLIKVVTLINSIKQRLTALEDQRREQWTRKDQEIFELRLQLQNPTIKVPATACEE